MSHQRCRAASADHHTAKPSAGNGEARPNGCQSARRDASDGAALAMRLTPPAICRGFHDDPRDVRFAVGTSQHLCPTLNPHRDRGAA